MVPVTPQSTVVAARPQVSAAVADEVVILHLDQGIYYGLNPVGALVWQLLAQPRTVAELCAAIVQEFEVELKRCEQDILALLCDLQARALIEVVGEAAA